MERIRKEREMLQNFNFSHICGNKPPHICGGNLSHICGNNPPHICEDNTHLCEICGLFYYAIDSTILGGSLEKNLVYIENSLDKFIVENWNNKIW